MFFVTRADALSFLQRHGFTQFLENKEIPCATSIQQALESFTAETKIDEFHANVFFDVQYRIDTSYISADVCEIEKVQDGGLQASLWGRAFRAQQKQAPIEVSLDQSSRSEEEL